MNRELTALPHNGQSVFEELLNPLTAVHALSEILRDYPCLDAGKRQEFLGIIIKETERLIRLASTKARGEGGLERA